MSDPAAPSRDRWRRLERLFRRALEGPPADRERLLAELGPEEADLRAELESLLTAHDAAAGEQVAGLGRGDGPGDALEARGHPTSRRSPRSPGDGPGFLEGLDPVRAAALLKRSGAGDGPAPGERVGPYRIVRPLGRGGMGVVYLAEDPRLGREVALKLLPPWLSSDALAGRRFTAEAKAASALDHPNIATIYEIDASEDGRPYIAMAYYEGETLAVRIARGPLGVEEAVGIASQVAEGLAAAHARGIVHRDVKPGNVMLTPEGVAKILDFGVAKVGDRALTRTGATLGTVAYMSPEQTRSDEVDARSDLWSLGVLMYEMLTGRRPFRADGEQALIYRIRHDEPEPLERIRPEVPDRVARLVGRCLRKDPAERPASALEVADALRGGRVPGMDAPGEGEGAGRPLARRTRIRAGVGALVLFVLLAGAYLAWSLLGGRPGEPAAVDRSIAVLPFENLSGTDDAEPYARGIHDDLLTRLSGISGLRVISRRAVERYRDSDLTTGAIARELGVRWVLEGGIAKGGDRIRVNAQLVDPRTESHAWADSYQRDLTVADLFAIQGEITLAIARSLETRLTPAERERLERRPTDDLAAYGLYVEGRTHLDQRTETGLRQGTELFRRAVALDSAYAPAWAGLADALALLAIYGHASGDTLLPAALETAERALALDPDLAEAHASRGLIYQTLRHDGPAALREFRRAVQLKPSYARAYHWLGNLLLALGRLEEAGEPLRRAVELDPTSPPIRVSLSRWYQYADSLEAALEQARRAEELSPSYPGGLMLAGEALRGMGRLEEARDALQRTLELPEVSLSVYPGIWVELALIHRTLGDTARARELVDRLEAETPPFVMAAVHAGMGRRDTALALLSAGPVIPDWAMILRYQHVFESLRGDPRYHELLREYDRAWSLGPEGEPSAGGPSG